MSARPALALLLALALPALAPAAAPCDAPPFRQFDFWVGHWRVFGSDGGMLGENRIERIDGGCALLERWTGRGGHSGSSLNHWDAASARWRQRWVDNQGGVLDLAGALVGNRMVLEGSLAHPQQAGAQQRQRIGWTPNADGTVLQRWEQSDDDGLTWSLVFEGLYRRVGEQPRP